MSRSLLRALTAGVVLGLASTLQAQAPAKPLTESELLKTLDGLGKGDPVTKQPLSARDQEPLPEKESAKGSPRKEKDKEEKDDKDPTSRSKRGETEITSHEGSFDQRTHSAVFTTKVFVKNPDFTLSCDKLTAFMKHDPTKSGSVKTQPGTNPNNRLMPATVEAGSATVTGPDGRPVARPPGANDKSGGLDRAIAEGSVVITQDKLDENGNLTQNIGRARKAVYESSTGDITLTGKPEIQQGPNTCIALDEETVFVLNRDGRMKTFGGRSKNTIRENSDKPNGR